MKRPNLRLYVVRHGQVAANRDFRYIGRRDDVLTELGEEQALRVGEALAEVSAQRLISSPRLRARATAEAIAAASGLEVEVEERLGEQSYGDWEGLTRDEVQGLGDEHSRRLATFDADTSVAPPGGESLAAAQRRVESLVDELYGDAGLESAVLVSHVGPIKALLGSALGLALENARRLFLDPGTISVIDWGSPPLVRLFNAHSHLGWQNARWMTPGAPVPRGMGAVDRAHSRSGSPPSTG